MPTTSKPRRRDQPLTTKEMQYYQSNGPVDTDLKGFERTKHNDPTNFGKVPTSGAAPTGTVDIASSIFNERYYEAYDVCFAFKKTHKKGEKIIKASDAEKLIMRMLPARKPGCEGSSDPNNLHSCYGLASSEVKKSYTYNELLQLFKNQTLKVIGTLKCYSAKSETKDGSTTLTRVKLDETRCKYAAQRINYPLKMNREVTTFDEFRRDPDFCPPWVPYEDQVERTVRDGSAMDVLGYVWQRYDRLSRPYNYSHKRDDKELTMFRDIDRVRLLMDLLNEYINTQIMMDKNFLETVYPLHQPAELDVLKSSWGTFRLCWTIDQPLNLLNSYFGEKTALYFAWMQSYSQMLTVPAFLGLILYILELCFDKELSYHQGWLNWLRVSYCAVITAWAAWFHRMWLRKENTYRLMWGSEIVTGAKEPLHKNPYFKPTQSTASDQSYASQKTTMTISQRHRYIRRAISGLLVFIITLSCVMIVNDEAFIAFFRLLGVVKSTSKQTVSWETLVAADKLADATSSKSSVFKGMWFVAFMPLVCIVKLISFLWDRVIVFAIARFENNPYFEQYYRSVALYSFVFKFSMHLAPVLYFAFLKEYFGEPCGMEEGRCVRDTRKMLQGFLVAGLTGNVVEIGWPLIQNLWKRMCNRKATVDDIPYYETQALQKNYKLRYQVEDFEEVMLEFCFVALFSSLFPLMPILNLIVSMVEIRSDAFKLCRIHQRPWPTRAPMGNGEWNDIQRCITFGCVLSNVLLCGLVTIGYHRSLPFKLSLSLLLLLVTLGFKEFIEYRFPEHSKKYRTMKARAYITHFEAIWGNKNVEGHKN